MALNLPLMKKKYLLFLMFFYGIFSYGQVLVINEIDSDNPGTDTKEFVEIKSQTPNFSLNGYVLVFFNGNPSGSTSNRSYFAIGLDGLTTDANGLVVIGNNDVSPVPSRIFSNSTIQNGPDAVAIFQGSYSDFPINTLANTTNLIHALGHGTSTDTAPTGLMSLLGNPQFLSEGNTAALTQAQSIQRKADGTYEAKLPTPGANNDGSGFVFNGVTISVPALQYNEGDNFNITFTTQTPVTSDLSFTFTLNNGTFNNSDFTGNTSILIPTGSSSITANIQIIDDAVDEGDEFIKIKFGALPEGFVRMNDNIEIIIIDNDFTVSNWGTPVNPTFGNVATTAPSGYYDSLNGKSGAQLKQAVQDIIANPAVVRAHNYGDITEILKKADQNPLHSNQVWLMYKEVSRAKYLFQDTGDGSGRWNREHIYPQSRGGYSNGTSSTPDGINVWITTNADSIKHGHADAHHLRAEDGPENSSRNNKNFGLTGYNGFSGNLGSWKGDVARSAFYMAVRYNGLNLVDGNPSENPTGQLGDLATLLQWNQSDPSDDFEMNRNNYIYTWQYNRNPFIDLPDLANYIWGANSGEAYTLSIEDNSQLKVALYPNPASNYLMISGIENAGVLEIYSISGQKILNEKFTGNTKISLNLTSGLYLAKITSEEKSVFKKIVIK